MEAKFLPVGFSLNRFTSLMEKVGVDADKKTDFEKRILPQLIKKLGSMIYIPKSDVKNAVRMLKKIAK